MDHQHSSQRGSANTITLVVIVFVALIALGTWAVYTYGDNSIVINGRGVDDLQPWEVIGGVILGIFGAIIGLVMGALGLVIGLAAAVLSIVLALAGVSVGLFITAGTLLGPFLLLAAIILLIRRSDKQKELEANARMSGVAGGAENSAMAKYWT